MRTIFTFVSLAFPLVGCLDRELVPLDASPDAIATDARTDGASACTECDAAHCVDGECVECTSATEAADCVAPERPTCVENVCGACTERDDCGRFADLPACATVGPLAGQCVACDEATDCLDPTAPRCDVTTRACLPCEGNPECARFPDTPVCALDGDRAGACVACAADTDCTDPTASRCDLATNTCVPCNDADQCTGPNENVCDAGTCVQCTEDTAATHCGANSCDPVARTCTTTPRNSVPECGACVSDTECNEPIVGVDALRCVPMEHAGVARPTGYCLRLVSSGCARPFAVATPARSSVSGAAAATYCGVLEESTTCEAVNDLRDGTTCTTDADCGAAGLDDGRCETTTGIPNLCTYDCGASIQCPLGILCGSVGDYCGSA